MTYNNTKKPFYWTLILIVFPPLVISGILAWVGYVRIHDFETDQQHIAHSSVEILSEDIGGLIEENQRLVKLFIKDEHPLIVGLANNPHNYALRAEIRKKIIRFFPNSLSFAITGANGKPIVDDFGGYIGKTCLDDIRQMIATKKYSVHIHPNPYLYHYDSLANWYGKKKHGVFLVSFSPDQISRLLRAASPVGQRLMLIIKNQGYLMEITEKGARNTVIRENYRLTSAERSRILDMLPVSHTQWQLIDVAEANLFLNFRIRVYRTYGLTIIAFILISIIFSIALINSERKRQQAESMRDEMLSLFSHDLRSPLIGIKGAMELLKDHGITISQDKKDHLYHLIHDYVMHMGRIVDDILDVHKLESGKMTLNFEEVTFRTLIEQAITMVRGYADQFQVELKWEDETNSEIYICVDKQRMIRAITNLLTNALKFTSIGESVIVRTRCESNKAIIAVEDHGPGIPLSLQPHVFQKFVQSRKRQVHNLPSTGLGLTIVKYITEEHSGKVYFESVQNKGTTFFIELPISKTAQNDVIKA